MEHEPNTQADGLPLYIGIVRDAGPRPEGAPALLEYFVNSGDRAIVELVARAGARIRDDESQCLVEEPPEHMGAVDPHCAVLLGRGASGDFEVDRWWELAILFDDGEAMVMEFSQRREPFEEPDDSDEIPTLEQCGVLLEGRWRPAGW